MPPSVLSRHPCSILLLLASFSSRDGLYNITVMCTNVFIVVGGTITFNLFDSDGVWIPHTIVEKQSRLYQISLRTG